MNQYVENILSAGIATQSVLDEIKTELDKISKQMYVHRVPITVLPASQPYAVVGEIEQEPPIQKFPRIQTEEMLAA